MDLCEQVLIKILAARGYTNILPLKAVRQLIMLILILYWCCDGAGASVWCLRVPTEIS